MGQEEIGMDGEERSRMQSQYSLKLGRSFTGALPCPHQPRHWKLTSPREGAICNLGWADGPQLSAIPSKQLSAANTRDWGLKLRSEAGIWADTDKWWCGRIQKYIWSPSPVWGTELLKALEFPEWQEYLLLSLTSSFDHTCCLVARSCPSLCNCINCSLPSSSVHGIFQARILEWAAVSFLPNPGIEPVSPASLLHCRQILYQWTTRKPEFMLIWQFRVGP